MKKSTRKLERKQRVQDLLASREKIAKAIRRHNGTEHASVAWGKGMGFLRKIHAEIKPLLEARHEAEDFIFNAKGRHDYGK